MARRTQITLSLECKLTPEEISNFAKLAAEANRAMAQADGELKSFTKEKKAIMQRSESDLDLFSGYVYSEKMYREVDCEIQYDFDSNEKHYIRKDTGELIDTKPMTATDRQENIDGIDDNKDTEPEPSPKDVKPGMDDPEAGDLDPETTDPDFDVDEPADPEPNEDPALNLDDLDDPKPEGEKTDSKFDLE